MRGVTENDALVAKRFEVAVDVDKPPVSAIDFALRLSLVLSFITKVLFAKAHSNNAFTAG